MPHVGHSLSCLNLHCASAPTAKFATEPPLRTPALGLGVAYNDGGPRPERVCLLRSSVELQPHSTKQKQRKGERCMLILVGLVCDCAGVVEVDIPSSAIEQHARLRDAIESCCLISTLGALLKSAYDMQLPA